MLPRPEIPWANASVRGKFRLGSCGVQRKGQEHGRNQAGKDTKGHA